MRGHELATEGHCWMAPADHGFPPAGPRPPGARLPSSTPQWGGQGRPGSSSAVTSLIRKWPLQIRMPGRFPFEVRICVCPKLAVQVRRNKERARGQHWAPTRPAGDGQVVHCPEPRRIQSYGEPRGNGQLASDDPRIGTFLNASFPKFSHGRAQSQALAEAGSQLLGQAHIPLRWPVMHSARRVGTRYIIPSGLTLPLGIPTWSVPRRMRGTRRLTRPASGQMGS